METNTQETQASQQASQQAGQFVVYNFRGNRVLVASQTGHAHIAEIEGEAYQPCPDTIDGSGKGFLPLGMSLSTYCEERGIQPKQRHMRVPPGPFDMLMEATREVARKKVEVKAEAAEKNSAETRVTIKPEPVHKMALETVAKHVYDALVAASLTNPRVRFTPAQGKLAEKIEIRFTYTGKKGEDKQASIAIFPTRTATGFTWRYALTEPRDLSAQGLGNLAQQGYVRKIFATAMAAVVEAKQSAE